jgi:hypothetical protein
LVSNDVGGLVTQRSIFQLRKRSELWLSTAI